MSSFSSECCCGSASIVPGAMLHVCNLPDCDHWARTPHSEHDTSSNWKYLALIFGGLSHWNLQDRKANISRKFLSGAVLKRFWEGCIEAELPSGKPKDGFPLWASPEGTTVTGGVLSPALPAFTPCFSSMQRKGRAGSYTTGESWRRSSYLYIHCHEKIHTKYVHSQANSKDYFPGLCFSLPPHTQSLRPSDNQKAQTFCHSSTNFMKLSGLHCYSQRLNSHIFLLTSLVLTFEGWLWNSLVHPHKTNRKTQRAILFGINSGMFEKVLSSPLSKRCKIGLPPCKKTRHPFPMHTHTHAYTSAQGQSRGAKLLRALPILKIELNHSSPSLHNTPQPQVLSYIWKSLLNRDGSQQVQDRTWMRTRTSSSPTWICESSAAPGSWWGPRGHRLAEKPSWSKPPGAGMKRGKGREVLGCLQ